MCQNRSALSAVHYLIFSVYAPGCRFIYLFIYLFIVIVVVVVLLLIITKLNYLKPLSYLILLLSAVH